MRRLWYSHPMSQANVEIKKSGSENNASVLRRFMRKMQESNVIRTVKGKRYSERKKSKLTQKKSALKRIGRRKEIEKLKKMGKFVETKTRGRR